MASWTLVTAPSAEPVTVAELKEHLRIDAADEDSYLSRQITAARQMVEERTWRALISQTWELRIDSFPSRPIRLPRPPLTSVTHVKYYDSDGTQQTLSTDVYEVDTAREPGLVRLKYNQSWPTVRGHDDDVEIRFVAGYGGAASDVPQRLRAAVLLMAAHLVEHREPVAVGTSVNAIPMALDALLAVDSAKDLRAEYG